MRRMAPRFLSHEWVEAAKARLLASKEFRAATKGQSIAIVAHVTDPPGGKPLHVYYEFENGKLVKAEVGRVGAVAHRHAEFTITGTYDAFAELQRGELSLASAYFKRKIKISGDIAFAIKFAPAFLKYNQIVHGVETTY